MNRPLTTALGWRLPAWLLDYGPVVVIVAEATLATALVSASALRVVALTVAVAIVAVALLLRHRAPLGVLAVVLAVTLTLNYGPVVLLPVLLAVFTVAEYSDRTRVIGAAVATAAVLVATPLLHGQHEVLTAGVSRIVAVGLAVAVGLYLRARADYVGGLHERAERLERERELLAAQAVAEERLRIARELHDVVAHNVSLMVVQAQAIAATHARSIDHQALGRVADLGREALSEMHRMLGVLRVQNGAAADREPQPGVRDLDGLIARTRQAGLAATLTVQGRERALPPGVDLSAYRIVQEALTNVIRHAHAEHAEVTLAYDDTRLELTIRDDGAGAPANGGGAPAEGHGLLGMRERVALFGGELEAGARPDGRGYQVRASLPLN